MGDSSRKIILPPILIVEGFWGVGKTTLLKALRNISPWPMLFVEEPNHLHIGRVTHIEAWYKKQHLKNWMRAIDEGGRNRHIVLERSILSSIAFYYAIHGKLPHWAYQVIRRMKNSPSDFKVICLYGTNTFLKTRTKRIFDQTVVGAIRAQPKFLSNYMRFYRRVLPDQFMISPLFIRVDEKGVFRKKREIRFDFVRMFPTVEVKNDICAACVAYYKDTFLILYDKTYKHYVLPQGHRGENERLQRTAVRELREETGFTDTSVLKRITCYQYHYLEGRLMTYKKIYVYLLRINSLKKQPKKFEAHENYKNFFMNKRKAIKKLHWKQDKRSLMKSLPFVI